MKAVVTLNESQSDVFEKKCNELVEQGYIMQSSHCSFLTEMVISLKEFGLLFSPYLKWSKKVKMVNIA